MELAIDTSTRTVGVALSRQGRALWELTWRAEYNHTTQLMPAIDHILRQGVVTPKDLDAIIIAIGPGSFSGLRVGVAAAKGMAMALGRPLVAVSTMATEAYPFTGAGLPVRPVLDAGRDEIATALFAMEGDDLREIEGVRITTVEELCAAVRQPTLFCGEHLPEVRAALTARLGPLALIPPDSALPRRAGNLAELGWRRLQQGQSDDLATLQPVYLRGPSITRPKAPVEPARK